MKILVTGGSGFLGIHLREFFEADDFSRRSNLDILNLQDVSMVEEYDVGCRSSAMRARRCSRRSLRDWSGC